MKTLALPRRVPRCAPRASRRPASRIVPAQPIAFELVNLRMTVDSCAFARTVRVAPWAARSRSPSSPTPASCPGRPELVDVQLGSLAPGHYRVEVYASPAPRARPPETLAFQVADAPRSRCSRRPRARSPTTPASGGTRRSRAGDSSLTKRVSNALFGALFVYGSSGQPEWYTLQGGLGLVDAWSGPVYRTTGPFFAGPHFDPRRC